MILLHSTATISILFPYFMLYISIANQPAHQGANRAPLAKKLKKVNNRTPYFPKLPITNSPINQLTN
jgi:hypothetical protein